MERPTWRTIDLGFARVRPHIGRKKFRGNSRSQSLFCLHKLIVEQQIN